MNNITTSHIIPTVQDALANPWDYELRISPIGWSLVHAEDDAISAFISKDDMKRIAYAMGKAADDEQLAEQRRLDQERGN